jgi:hypothetical protein
MTFQKVLEFIFGFGIMLSLILMGYYLNRYR